MNYYRFGTQNISQVAELMKVFATAFSDEKSYLSKPPAVSYNTRLLSNPNNIVLGAATETGEIVGGLIAYELQKFEQEYSEVYLYDLAVAEAYRRHGVASGLINELKVHAKKCGAKVIFVQAEDEDLPAMALYTKLCSSIEAAVTHFDIPVEK